VEVEVEVGGEEEGWWYAKWTSAVPSPSPESEAETEEEAADAIREGLPT
jgi:hypothetical protein